MKYITGNFVILVIALTLLNCAGNRIKYPSSYPSVPFKSKAGDLILKTGTFETTAKKKYKADFGTLVVPENREKPDSRLINLPVIRIYALNSNSAEPIFLFSGGPGGTNIHTDTRGLDFLFSNHDFVMVGYRGIDGSTVLDCPEVAKAVKGEGDDVLSEKSLKSMGEAWTRCADRLKKEGIDIDAYTIMEVIEDMEAARIAFGYKRINLFSGSYGTRVAYIYGLKYPNSIYRSVMVGVNPPGHFVWEPETIDRQLKYYADLWAKDPKMSARTSDLLATMHNVAHNMPRRWLLFKIDPGKVRILTFNLLFRRNTAALAFDAYVAAEKGDPSGLALMSMAYDFGVPSSGWGDQASKAVSADFDSSRNYFSEMDPPNSIIGSPLAKALWGPFSFGYRWPIKQIPEEYRKLQRSDVETLLISGSIDFSTPKESAEELLPYLSKGKHVVFSEMGHTGDIYNVRPGATELLLTSFYNTGVPDTSLCTHVPMDFNVKWSFPKIAKIGLGVAVGGTAIVVGGLVWLIRFTLNK